MKNEAERSRRKKLRGTLFGGYNKKGVKKLIEEMEQSVMAAKQMYDEKISGMAQEIGRLRKENESLIHGMENLAAQRDEAAEHAELILNESRILKRKNLNSAAQIAAMALQLKDYENQIGNLTAGNFKYERIRVLKAKYEELQEVYDSSVCSREEYLKENISLVMENSDLKKICSKLAGKNEEMNKYIFRLQNCLKKYDSAVQTIEGSRCVTAEIHTIDDVIGRFEEILDNVDELNHITDSIRSSADLR